MSGLLPHLDLGCVRNAARLAAFGNAAYLCATDSDTERQAFEGDVCGGRLFWWHQQAARGLVYVDAESVVIALTDLSEGAPAAFGAKSSSVRQWSESTGIPVPNDAREVRVGEQLLPYATSAYFGVERALQEHFCLSLRELSKPMWMVGHGWGGAAMQLLQCTTLFSHTRSYAYGCPRPFVEARVVPARLRVRVHHPDDAAAYGPAEYGHADAEQLIIRCRGVVGRGNSWRMWPTTALHWLLAKAGQATRWSGSQGMNRYLSDLHPLQ